MTTDSPAALLARLRNSPPPRPEAPPPASPSEAARRWVEARGLRPGTHPTPPATLLLPLLLEWVAAQGWQLAPTSNQLGEGMRLAGLTRRQRNRWRGYATTRAQAALLWAEVRARHPEGLPEEGANLEKRRPHRPGPPRWVPPPVLPLPSYGHPLVDSHGAVWHSAAQAAQALKTGARNLFRALDGEYVSCAGRLWRRLPEDESWVARLPPGALVGQPGTLCLCAGVPPRN